MKGRRGSSGDHGSTYRKSDISQVEREIIMLGAAGGVRMQETGFAAM